MISNFFGNTLNEWIRISTDDFGRGSFVIGNTYNCRLEPTTAQITNEEGMTIVADKLIFIIDEIAETSEVEINGNRYNILKLDALYKKKDLSHYEILVRKNA